MGQGFSQSVTQVFRSCCSCSKRKLTRIAEETALALADGQITPEEAVKILSEIAKPAAKESTLSLKQ